MRAAAYRRFVKPFLDLLRQGITPEKVALTIALGIALGVTPVIGSTTVLCTLAAIALRLNLPAIYLVNGVTYPLQLVLIIPFLRAGAWLFGDRLTPVLSVGRMFHLIRADLWGAIDTLCDHARAGRVAALRRVRHRDGLRGAAAAAQSRLAPRGAGALIARAQIGQKVHGYPGCGIARNSVNSLVSEGWHPGCSLRQGGVLIS